MKLSPETVEILSNFSRINNSILIQEGSEFYTRNDNRTIFGIANVAEQFPTEMAIHDLQSVLQYFKMTGNAPDIDVSDNNDILLINGNGVKVQYKLADKDIIVCQEKEPSIEEDPFAEVELTEENLQTISTAKNVGITKADTVEFCCDGFKYQVKIYNQENSASNVVTVDLEGTSEKQLEFSIKFKDDQFPMIMQDYTLKLYERVVGDSTAFFGVYESDLVKYVTPAKAQAGCMVKEL